MVTTTTSILMGDISPNITLVDIFQTLKSKQLQGWLVVKPPNEIIQLYVDKNLVGLGPRSSETLSYIPEKLYYARKISREQYQKAKSRKDEALGYLQTTAFKPLARALEVICYDQMCKIIALEKGRFEFIKQHTFISPKTPKPSSKLFDIDEILMEAAKRRDEWPEITQQLPSFREILVRNRSDSEPLLPRDECLGNVYNLADRRSIRDILLCSYFSEFEAAKALAKLYTEKALAVIDAEELCVYAQAMGDEGKIEVAIACYEVLHQRQSDSIKTQNLLAAHYEKTGTEEYLNKATALAKNLLTNPEPDAQAMGVAHIQTILSASMDCPQKLDENIELFLLAMKHSDDLPDVIPNSTQQGKQLLIDAYEACKYEKAKQIAQSLLKHNKKDVDLQSSYAEILLQLNEVNKAVAEYEKIARVYEQRSDLVRIKPVYQQILRLQPSRQDISLRIKFLSKSSKKRAFASTIIIGTILAITFAWIWLHNFFVQKERNKIIANLETILQQKNWHAAENLLERLPEEKQEKYWPQIQLLKQTSNRRAGELLDRAEKAEDQGKLRKVIKLLQKALQFRPEDQIEEEIHSKLEVVKVTMEEFTSKWNKAKKSEKECRWEDAVNKYLALWRDPRFSKIEDRKNIYLPISFKVWPLGATISLSDKEYKTISKPEEILHIPPDFKTLKIFRTGYKPFLYYNALSSAMLGQVTINSKGEKLHPLNTPYVDIKLSKALFWSFPLAESVVGTYATTKNIYIACNNGYAYAFANIAQTPRLLWSQAISGNALAGGIVYFRKILYVAEKNGVVHALNADTVQRLAICKLKHPLKTLILADKIGKILCVQSNGKIVALPPYQHNKEWEPIWSSKITKDISSHAFVEKNMIVVAKKNLLGIDLNRGSQLWTMRLQMPPSAPISVIGSAIFLAGYGYVYALDAESRVELWRTQIKEGVRATPFVYKKIVYCATTTGTIYALSARNGNVLWKVTSSSVFETQPVMNEEKILYVGSQNGWLYAIKNGELIWKYKTGRDAITSLFIRKNLLFIVSKRLYTFINN